ncbi:MAG: hypothetical protein BWX88_04016 [Planctomycetes bacterium ADurb.Bin126]|nr:MAG: hypothetical protein BWX88_04016 [Planctomycetes bacterium ADurb.Bin126]HOD84404.1 hypothetical protein [Phycisphaerae bacterium]HQL75621.1 hypothetical protein [Phycisphaerae bacterium]
MPSRGLQSRAAFRCPNCKKTYGDPAYHGPSPHAPARLCFGCWAEKWAEFEQRASRGGDWTALDEALWLVCMGFSQSEASNLIARDRSFLARWLQRMRKYPHLVPDWLGKSDS